MKMITEKAFQKWTKSVQGAFEIYGKNLHTKASCCRILCQQQPANKSMVKNASQ
jgi:hypothetical protein